MDVRAIEVLTLVAIVVGPFVGVWAYGKIEDGKRAYARKLHIFKTLMATRGTALSEEHVGALNMIDVEFTGDKYKKVRDLWTAYLDHLNNGPQLPPSPRPDANEEEKNAFEKARDVWEQDAKTWNTASNDRLAALLSEMGRAFKYDFDEVRIKKAVYRPKGHADRERLQERLLSSVADTFEGRRSLPMFVINWPEQTDEQRALIERMLSTVDKDGAHRVRIVSE